jgi:hypothetical protein
MGERKLLAVGCALVSALGLLPAQGPVYRERWGHLFLERLRAEVWRGLEGRDAAMRAKVADLLAQPSKGLPFAAPAQALAALRGVEADAAFLLRATVGVFSLPEVCDPNATNEVCRKLNASVFLPFTVEVPGTLSFAVEARDRSGDVKYSVLLSHGTSLADLRQARPAAIVPCEELADGTYELIVRTLLDGVEPRATDPILRVKFHVLRGYQQRSEEALGLVRQLGPQLSAMPRALLEGMAAEVSRAYIGEAFDVETDAPDALARLEAALENLREGRHVLHGFVGDLPTGLPTGSSKIACVLRIGEGRNPADAPTPRPLVVVAGGSPAYDITALRPSAPATRGPRWLAAELATFGKGQPWDVAFLESPGGGRNYADELREAVKSLRLLWAVGDRPVVLVCDREAAAVVGFQLGSLRPQIQGLVLVGSGGMPASVLDGLGALPVRIGMLQGYPSGEGLRRALEYVTMRQSEKQWQGDFAVLTGEAPAWLFGLRGYAPAITKFVAGVVGG